MILILNDLFRGQTDPKSVAGLDQCSIGDWISFMTFGSVCFIMSVFSIQHLKFLYKWKRKAGYMMHITDVHWNFES